MTFSYLNDGCIFICFQICNRASSPFGTNVNIREVEIVKQVFANFTQVSLLNLLIIANWSKCKTDHNAM